MNIPLRVEAFWVASQRVALVLFVVSSLLLSGACTRRESAPESLLAHPTGIAGTRFGMSEEAVKALLPDLEWQPERPIASSALAPHVRIYRASGRSFRGVPGLDLELRFFQGKLYFLIFRYADTLAASVRAALEEQFGKPTLVWKSPRTPPPSHSTTR